MEDTSIIWQILIALGIPTAVVGVMFHKLERRITKAEVEREQKDADRRKFERNQFKLISAVAAVTEANAIALQNGKCNGETHKALDYMEKVKHEQRDFLVEQGVDSLF